MTTLPEAAFEIDSARLRLANGGMPRPVTGLDVGLCEDGRTVTILFEVDANWHSASFDLPARIDPGCFCAEYYELETLRLLRQWRN